MTKLYVAYEDGVYRQGTIAVALSEEDLYPSILEYFSKTDDYHNITVEVLEASLPATRLCRYKIQSDRVKVLHHRYTSRQARHGKRVVYRDDIEVDSFWQDYQLKDGESFAP